VFFSKRSARNEQNAQTRAVSDLSDPVSIRQASTEGKLFLDKTQAGAESAAAG
jgi:hypothetical protein